MKMPRRAKVKPGMAGRSRYGPAAAAERPAPIRPADSQPANRDEKETIFCRRHFEKRQSPGESSRGIPKDKSLPGRRITTRRHSSFNSVCWNAAAGATKLISNCNHVPVPAAGGGDADEELPRPVIFPKNFLMEAITATNATMTSFANFLKNTTSHVNKPSLAAPTAAPPTTSAANPYFATLSPARYSA